MAHYIDAEKIIAFLKKAKAEHIIGGDYSDGVLDTCNNTLDFIDSLQQEQPSLPSNLDEAAEEYAGVDYDFETEPNAFYHYIEAGAFKAGAEWIAGQGETQEHFVIGSIAGSPCGPAVVCYTEKFVIGDEVIVQIRKK